MTEMNIQARIKDHEAKNDKSPLSVLCPSPSCRFEFSRCTFPSVLWPVCGEQCQVHILSMAATGQLPALLLNVELLNEQLN